MARMRELKLTDVITREMMKPRPVLDLLMVDESSARALACVFLFYHMCTILRWSTHMLLWHARLDHFHWSSPQTWVMPTVLLT